MQTYSFKIIVDNEICTKDVKTLEHDVKKIPLKVIKDKSEYEEHKVDLESYLEERYWLSHAENPIAEVSTNVKEKLHQLNNVERGSKEEAELLHQIHLLQVKFNYIKEGKYESILMEKIKAETMMLDEYELKREFDSFGKFAKGLITGNKNAKKLLGYIVLRETGREATPERIDVTPKSKVLFDLAKNSQSSWVNINTEEIESLQQQELSLVPYQDVAVSKIEQDAENTLQQEVMQLIKEKEEKTTKMKIEKNRKLPQKLNHDVNKKKENEHQSIEKNEIER